MKTAPKHQKSKQKKEVRTAPRHSHNSIPPSWQFSKIETCDPFGWHVLQGEKLHQLLERIQAFESMTWNEILVEGKKHHHSISTDNLEKTAKDRLAELFLDDIEYLVSLKVDGCGRIWGIRQESILLLLWWDPDHKVCKSQKKHT